MRPAEIATLIDRDPRLIIPVGTCEQHGPHMPLGCDTIIVERLAADLSAEFAVLNNFPYPDLVPVTVTDAFLEEVRATLGEFPAARRELDALRVAPAP